MATPFHTPVVGTRWMFSCLTFPCVFQDEVNGMMRVFGTVEFGADPDNVTLGPMPTFEKLFPELASFLPTKGQTKARGVFHGVSRGGPKTEI
jgi:hypothetical protein